MGKLKYFFSLLALFCLSLGYADEPLGMPAPISKLEISMTSGHLWKRDKEYKYIYGNGIHNIVTLDATYFPYKNFGFGAQVGYWNAKGETHGCQIEKYLEKGQKETTWKHGTQDRWILTGHPKWKKIHRLHQVPLLAYVKARIGVKLQPYVLIGAGAVIAKEKVEKERSTHAAPAFIAEIGLKYHFCKCAFFNVDAHWINSHKKINNKLNRNDFGGKGFKLGFGAAF